MSTFGTYDIDSVPAPSDIELAMLDERNERARYDFNGAVTALAIFNTTREPFHAWLEQNVRLDFRYVLDDWRCFFNAFIQGTDARDQRETLEDALR